MPLLSSSIEEQERHCALCPLQDSWHAEPPLVDSILFLRLEENRGSPFRSDHNVPRIIRNPSTRCQIPPGWFLDGESRLNLSHKHQQGKSNKKLPGTHLVCAPMSSFHWSSFRTKKGNFQDVARWAGNRVGGPRHFMQHPIGQKYSPHPDELLNKGGVLKMVVADLLGRRAFDPPNEVLSADTHQHAFYQQ